MLLGRVRTHAPCGRGLRGWVRFIVGEFSLSCHMAGYGRSKGVAAKVFFWGIVTGRAWHRAGRGCRQVSLAAAAARAPGWATEGCTAQQPAHRTAGAAPGRYCFFLGLWLPGHIPPKLKRCFSGGGGCSRPIVVLGPQPLT